MKPFSLVAILVVAAGCNQAAAPTSSIRPALMQVVSGQDQTGAASTELPTPLQVIVLDSAGGPVPGQIVNFKVTAGGGSMFAGVGLTNASGMTQDRWTLGPNPLDSQRVEARAVDAATGAALTFAVFRAQVGPPPPRANALRLMQIAVGVSSVCGLGVDSAAYCWGRVLGDTTGQNSLIPTLVGGGNHFKSITAGYAAHVCAFTTTVGAVCWGSNGAGELGNGTYTPSLTPVAVSGGLNFAALSVGNGFTCGLTTPGLAYCWGTNRAGMLGTGDTVPSSTPRAVTGGHTFLLIAAGVDHACAVTATGAAYCWGANRFFQSGDSSAAYCPTTDPCNLVPRLEKNLPPLGGIAAGEEYTCGVTTTAAAYCWGSGGNGGLGDGTGSTQPTPVAVAGSLQFALLTTSGQTTCGLTLGGLAYCWGEGDVGEIGSGLTETGYNPRTPVAVLYGMLFTTLSASLGSTCGIVVSGTTYCWGYNGEGELGNGSTMASPSPVPIGAP